MQFNGLSALNKTAKKKKKIVASNNMILNAWSD